jgi:hypothetical protein
MKNAMKPDDGFRPRFETSDLHLTSFLCSRCFHIEEIRRQNSRAIFVFVESSELQRAVVEYANDGLVGVRSFCNTLRDLKAIAR